MKTARIVVPYGQKVDSIKVNRGPAADLPAEYNILHEQLPWMSAAADDTTASNPAVYNSAKPYPGYFFKQMSVQSKDGVQILIVNLFPVQCTPNTGKITQYQNLEIQVTTGPADPDSIQALPGRTLLYKVKSAVDNPEVMGTGYHLHIHAPLISLGSLPVRAD